MKISEVTSAEDQLALWRLISNNVWAAVTQQARDEAKRSEQQRLEKNATGVKRKGVVRQRVAAPSLPPLPPPPAAVPTPTPQPSSNDKAKADPPSVAGGADSRKRPANGTNSGGNARKKFKDETDDRHSKNGPSPLRR